MPLKMAWKSLIIDYLSSKGILPGQRIFCFIDEIQYHPKPSKFLKVLHDHHPDVKLIVSGSSSFAISHQSPKGIDQNAQAVFFRRRPAKHRLSDFRALGLRTDSGALVENVCL